MLYMPYAGCEDGGRVLRYQRLTNRWCQLSACMIAMIAIANLQYTWTLFTLPLSTGLNAKLSDIQLAFTLFIVTQSWLVPVEGFLVDRLGARIVIVAGGLLVGLSWVGYGFSAILACAVCVVCPRRPRSRIGLRRLRRHNPEMVPG
jgi:MFS family permease